MSRFYGLRDGLGGDLCNKRLVDDSSLRLDQSGTALS